MGSHTSPADVQQVLDAFRRIVQALRESSRAAESRAGLTGAQLFVLQVVADGQPLSINEVAERTHTHQSSVSVVVQRLVDTGLLRRRRSEEDGRRQELSLSAKGERHLKDSPDTAQRELIDAIAALPEKQRVELARTLGTLASAVAPGTKPPAMFFEDKKAPRAKGRRNG